MGRTNNRHIEQGNFTSSYDRWRWQQSDRWGDFIWGLSTSGQFLSEREIAYYALQNDRQGNSKELPGDFRFVDTNGDGIIDDRDRTPMFWHEKPMVFYGLNATVTWKNLDFYIWHFYTSDAADDLPCVVRRGRRISQ